MAKFSLAIPPAEEEKWFALRKKPSCYGKAIVGQFTLE